MSKVGGKKLGQVRLQRTGCAATLGGLQALFERFGMLMSTVAV